MSSTLFLTIPHSNEIMQHLAESCRSSNVQNIGTDGRRMTSFGSTVTNHNFQDGYEASRHAYDNIEAEIDQLKEDVMRLREEADQGQTTPKTEQELGSDKFLSTRSGPQQSVSTESALESAAARLQRQHEAGKSDNGAISQDHSTVQQPLSPLDFPALEGSRPSSKGVSPNTPGSQQRKLSYADAITNGMIHANNHAFSAAMAKRADTKISDSTSEGPLSVASILSRTQTSSTAATQDSCENREEEEYSVIISPRSVETESSTNEPVVVSKGQHSVTNGKPAKQPPRFAQPTQSFSRRTGETLRVGSSPVSPKGSPGGSPTKSIKTKEPTLATDKRATQRQQKRKSLPGDWLGADGQQPDHIVPDVATKAAKAAMATPEKMSSPDSAISPSSAEGWQVVEGRHAKENATMMRAKAKQLQGQSPEHQKTKSYMASTNAATQRTIATLGEEKAKRDPQPQGKSGVSHPRTAHESQHTLALQRSSTLSSETSSVQFILDRALLTSDPSLEQFSNIAEGRSVKLHDSRIQAKAPAVAPSPMTAAPCNTDQSLSSNLPKPATHIEHRAQHQVSRGGVSHTTDRASFESLPEVANTTTKRRTSRGHLLKPIVACLDAKGLLNKTSANNAVVESYLKSMSAESSGNASKSTSERISESSNRVSEGSFDASQQIGSKGPVKKALAPHLRKAREASHASTSTEATLCPEPGLLTSGTSQGRDISDVPTLPRETPAGVLGSSLGLPHGTPSVGQASRVSSLRATANEFKPTKCPTDELSHFDLQAALRYMPEDEWLRMSHAKREAVWNLRRIFNKGRPRTANAMLLQRSPPRAPLKSIGHLPVANTMAKANTYDPSIKTVNDNGSPNGVQAGQILKPRLIPGKKTVQWMLQDIDGKETPIKFGRAAPPNVTPIFEPSTPTVSSTSNDTTPLKTPHSLRGWQIGSAFSPVPYGWTGGDGKEIKFVGYGPHAERDPSSVVNFNFQGRTGSYSASVPNGFNEDKENRPSEAHVAPKSQRQWAEKFGYQKVPCGNVEISQAVEYCIPFGSQLAGYCHDCMASK